MKEYSFDERDVRIDTMRLASYVNEADSGVRVVHLPTGFDAQSCILKGQHRNRRHALSILNQKLLEAYGSDIPSNYPKPKLTTVWEGDSLDILARESVEGLTKHQPKGKSRYGNQD